MESAAIAALCKVALKAGGGANGDSNGVGIEAAAADRSFVAIENRGAKGCRVGGTPHEVDATPVAALRFVVGELRTILKGERGGVGIDAAAVLAGFVGKKLYTGNCAGDNDRGINYVGPAAVAVCRLVAT